MLIIMHDTRKDVPPHPQEGDSPAIGSLDPSIIPDVENGEELAFSVQDMTTPPSRMTAIVRSLMPRARSNSLGTHGDSDTDYDTPANPRKRKSLQQIAGIGAAAAAAPATIAYLEHQRANKAEGSLERNRGARIDGSVSDAEMYVSIIGALQESSGEVPDIDIDFKARHNVLTDVATKVAGTDSCTADPLNSFSTTLKLLTQKRMQAGRNGEAGYNNSDLLAAAVAFDKTPSDFDINLGWAKTYPFLKDICACLGIIAMLNRQELAPGRLSNESANIVSALAKSIAGELDIDLTSYYQESDVSDKGGGNPAEAPLTVGQSILTLYSALRQVAGYLQHYTAPKGAQNADS